MAREKQERTSDESQEKNSNKKKQRKERPKPKSGIPPLAVDTDEAAALLGIPVATLHSMRTRGGGPPYSKLGGLVRYEVKELEKWLAGHRVRNTADTPMPSANNVANAPARELRAKAKTTRKRGRR